MEADSGGAGGPGEERWVTDDDLLAARRRFAQRIPRFRPPVAYGVARVDGGRLTFGHVNDVPGSAFEAFYVTDVGDPAVNAHDAFFRSLLASGLPQLD